MWIVTKKKDKKSIDVTRKDQKEGFMNFSKKLKNSNEVPLHLGSFILAHSKRLMNNFILAIDGYKKPNKYYGDTDSLYTNKEYFDLLDNLGYVGNNLCQGKNDYGSGGIIFGLFSAPKVKFNILLDDGILSVKLKKKDIKKLM